MYLESTREKRTTLRTKDNEVDRQKAHIGTEELECIVSNSTQCRQWHKLFKNKKEDKYILD